MLVLLVADHINYEVSCKQIIFKILHDHSWILMGEEKNEERKMICA